MPLQHLYTRHENTNGVSAKLTWAACAFHFRHLDLIPAAFEIQVVLMLMLASRRSMSRHGVDILVRNMLRVAGRNTAFL